MPQHQPAHARETATGPNGRRTVLAAGAAAAAGALGVALARPAEAAAGSALLLGRSNTSGGSGTTVASTSTGSAFYVKASAGNGILCDAASASKWAVYARSTATTAGTAGAVFGKGGKNVGVQATTAAPVSPVSAQRPALYADGGAGGWGSLVVGDEVVDGAVFASFALTGVHDPSQTANGGVGYADVVSGAGGYHVATGTLTLGAATTTGTVTLDPAFRSAGDLGRASVQLTPMGQAMSGLYASLDAATGVLTVNGGVAAGVVSWTVSAPRKNLDGTVVARAGSAAVLGRGTAMKALRAGA
ncbi:hypothetical protein [Kineosporia sp. R_H_3]|uniref:hypothetical protein n=1 Tax=Kineosporia sp. R_H_3 TaxID=1961848 RepID=UPI000B4B3740|nr:hypothetical protein [Kineosporia sp. R_H_3]